MTTQAIENIEISIKLTLSSDAIAEIHAQFIDRGAEYSLEQVAQATRKFLLGEIESKIEYAGELASDNRSLWGIEKLIP